MFSREQLANDLRKLGVVADDTVMLHVSVRAVGEIAVEVHVESINLPRRRGADGSVGVTLRER